ncbi:MAG TPA: hypothetical protein VME69_10390 [Methylocella sp.]|nr:hypothetical protein [Methylocella sp.]
MRRIKLLVGEGTSLRKQFGIASVAGLLTANRRHNPAGNNSAQSGSSGSQGRGMAVGTKDIDEFPRRAASPGRSLKRFRPTALQRNESVKIAETL